MKDAYELLETHEETQAARAKTKPKIPLGYRQLGQNEIKRPGDKFWTLAGWMKVTSEGKRVGERLIVIREDRKEHPDYGSW